MKNKFSKNSAKKKNMLRTLILIMCLIVLFIGIILLVIGLKNIIEVSNVDDNAKTVSDDIAKNSTPILINNLLVGAVYSDTWVSSERFYFLGQNKEGTKVDVYTSSGKKGTYEIKKITKAANESAVYISTSNSNKSDEYVAIATSSKDIMPLPAKIGSDVSDEEYISVKEALGIYKILNSSVNIREVYDVQIDSSNKGKIYVVNSISGKNMGGYSAIIYIRDNGKANIVKYSYVSNLKKSSDWPIYSFKFIADLNQDGKNELILQETKEFSVSYDVVEYDNEKFIQVLSASMNI